MRTLSQWREEIDRVDREIVSLLNRRAKTVLGLAPLKEEQGMKVREPGREETVLGNVAASNHGPLSNEALGRIYRALIKEMRAVQRGRFD